MPKLLTTELHEAAVEQYLMSAVWADGDEEDADKYRVSSGFRRHADADITRFFELAGHLIPDNLDKITDAAHDLWLTRQGHGAGFWDGDWGDELGDQLTAIVKEHFPHKDFYLSDNSEYEVMGHED